MRHYRSWMSFVFLTSGLLAVHFPLLPAREHPAGSDPRMILQQSADACLAVQSIQYEETHEPPRGQTVDFPLVKAIISQARAKVPDGGYLPGYFRVEGILRYPDGKQESLQYAYDGLTFRWLDNQEKILNLLTRPPVKSIARLLGYRGMAGFPQFTEAEPFKKIRENMEGIAFAGREEINGTPCLALDITTTFEMGGEKFTSTARWYIGETDHLPRGVETSGLRRTIRILEHPAVLPASSEFGLTVPPGYREVARQPDELQRSGLLPAGAPAPAWSLTGLDGQTYSLAGLRGKIVILDFWATWCGPCRKTMPLIQQLHDRFKDRGVMVFGLPVADPQGDPAAFVKEQGYTYPQLQGGDTISRSYQAKILPTLYVIGPDGKILHAEYGYREGLAAGLSQLIEKNLPARQ